MGALTSTDEAVFTQAIRGLSPIDDSVLAAILDCVRVRELERGQYLLRAGEWASEVAIVVSGLLREHFVTAQGTERTKAFVMAGQPTGSLADLLAGQPSRAFVVAEEPSRLLVSSFANSVELADRFDSWRRYSEQLMRRVLILKATREYELLCLDADARYEVFKKRYPGLETRVAARHVASYLGVTPVHLSRLRRRRSTR